MNKWHPFPRSLRQLVILALSAVLLSLLLAWQACQSFDTLSERAAGINHSILADARLTENMTSLAPAIKRSYRQCCVLDDPTPARLQKNQRQWYLQTLSKHGDLLPNTRYRQCLESLLVTLDQLYCENSSPGGQTSTQLKAFLTPTANWCRRRSKIFLFAAASYSRPSQNRGTLLGW